jgi:AcrR family transcriptional regulator
VTFEPLTPERRRQQTREHLLEAAARVFAERGYHGASLDEVASAAGFTKGAVYSNFQSKEDLFLALLESRYDRDMAALRSVLEASQGEPEAHLSDFVTHLRNQFGGSEWTALYLEFCVYALRHEAAREKLAAFNRADVEAVAELIETERARHGLAAFEPAVHRAQIVGALIRGLDLVRAVDPEAVDQALLESAMAFVARALTIEPGE